MDKLKMAHEMALAMAADGNVPNENIVAIVWQYADAMQAEAEKRTEALCEVDWSQAPKGQPVTGWYIFKGVAHWITDEFPCGPAPSFGFTGSHIVERPHGF